MPPTNDYLPWATGQNPNLLSQAAYISRADRPSGVIQGTASGLQANKTWRQSSVIAAMIAQFVADTLAVDVLDDGNVAALEAKFIAAVAATFHIPDTGVVPGVYPQANVTVESDGRITAIASGRQADYAVDSGGAANTYVVTLSPAPASLGALTGVLLDIKISHTNTGASTLNANGFGATPIIDEQGRALTAGAVFAGGIYGFVYNGTSFQLISRGSVFADDGTGGVAIDGRGNASGGNLWLRGNGGITPDKYIAAAGGLLSILNSAYHQIASLSDAGALTLSGGLLASGAGAFSGALSAGSTMSAGAAIYAPVGTGFSHCRIFSTPGTTNFGIPPNVTQMMAEVWGAGAAGGSSGSSVAVCGSGGGAGGYTRKLLTGLTAGTIWPITVGAGGLCPGFVGGQSGGTSSVSGFLVANGGFGGPAQANLPGQGGVAAGGDVNISGGWAKPNITFGNYALAGSNTGGSGGDAPGGGGGGGVGSNGAGVAGIWPGGAGGGAGDAGPSLKIGGPGANGLVILWW